MHRVCRLRESQVCNQHLQPSLHSLQRDQKKDLKELLSNIQGEKKKHGDDTSPAACADDDLECRFRNELTLYETMPELSADNNPLTWWKTHESTLPTLAKKFLKKFSALKIK